MNTFNFEQEPYILRMIDISTAHITTDERDLLEKASEGTTANPIIAYKYTYGFLIVVPDSLDKEEISEISSHGYSESFIKILKGAKEKRCTHIMFDADGIQYEDLPTFDW